MLTESDKHNANIAPKKQRNSNFVDSIVKQIMQERDDQAMKNGAKSPLKTQLPLVRIPTVSGCYKKEISVSSPYNVSITHLTNKETLCDKLSFQPTIRKSSGTIDHFNLFGTPSTDKIYGSEENLTMTKSENEDVRLPQIVYSSLESAHELPISLRISSEAQYGSSTHIDEYAVAVQPLSQNDAYEKDT